MKQSVIAMFIMMLTACNESELNPSSQNEKEPDQTLKPEQSQPISLREIKELAQSDTAIPKKVTLEGTFYYYQDSNTTTVEPCSLMNPSNTDDFTFSNDYQAISYDAVTSDRYGFYFENEKLRLSDWQLIHIDNSCDHKTELALRGMLRFDTVHNYCSLTTHPSAYLELDDDSMSKLNAALKCSETSVVS